MSPDKHLHMHVGTAIRLLIVEDSLPDVELVVGLLKDDGLTFTYSRVETTDTLIRAVTEGKPDVVLSDMRMPNFDGMEALHLVRELAPDVPFIFVSGTLGEERAIEALKQGAADYVLKDNPQRLAAAVRRAISHAREQQAYEARIEHAANYDRLTDLPNRRLLEDRGVQAVAHARRSGRPCAVFVMNIDRFSLITESHGHRTADDLLCAVAQRLGKVLRDGDTLAHFGDNVFALLAIDLARAEDALVIASRIRDGMQAEFPLGEHETRVTVSTGISTFPRDGKTFDIVLRNAAIAANRAREHGIGEHQFYLPQMNENAQAALRLQVELVRALQGQQFALYYQPKAALADGRITGLEALLRWNHPERGIVAPDEFIPVLEDTGLIVEVGFWVITAVCRQIRLWKSAGLRVPAVAINLSARQFQQPDLAAFMRTALEVTGVEAGLLEFELTESMLMCDATVRAIADLKACGVSLAIDDFGTGYSSLSYLRRFPVDALKIDRSFIAEVPARREDAAITQAIIRLAHTLQFKVVAEGVETPAQLAFLASNGCDEVQGYYFSPPLPEPQITRMLRENPLLSRPANITNTSERTLLIVDADTNVSAALERLLRGDGYHIHAASDARRAFEILSAVKVGVIVCGERISESTGVRFLQRVKEFYPDTVRIALSSEKNLDEATQAVNDDVPYRFVAIPWGDDLLRAHIADAFRHYSLMRECARAHQEALSQLKALTRANRSLEALVDARQGERGGDDGRS